MARIALVPNRKYCVRHRSSASEHLQLDSVALYLGPADGKLAFSLRPFGGTLTLTADEIIAVRTAPQAMGCRTDYVIA